MTNFKLFVPCIFSIYEMKKPTDVTISILFINRRISTCFGPTGPSSGESTQLFTQPLVQWLYRSGRVLCTLWLVLVTVLYWSVSTSREQSLRPATTYGNMQVMVCLAACSVVLHVNKPLQWCLFHLLLSALNNNSTHVSFQHTGHSGQR
jgi:hypothetical protein